MSYLLNFENERSITEEKKIKRKKTEIKKRNISEENIVILNNFKKDFSVDSKILETIHRNINLIGKKSIPIIIICLSLKNYIYSKGSNEKKTYILRTYFSEYYNFLKSESGLNDNLLENKLEIEFDIYFSFIDLFK